MQDAGSGGHSSQAEGGPTLLSYDLDNLDDLRTIFDVYKPRCDDGHIFSLRVIFQVTGSYEQCDLCAELVHSKEEYMAVCDRWVSCDAKDCFICLECVKARVRSIRGC